MKRRFSSHTTLIELTIALLCFLIASVTVLGLFTKAYRISQDGKQLRRAAVLAQDCAELIAGSQDAASALTDAGYGSGEDGQLCRNDGDLTVNVAINEEQTEVGALLMAQIRVMRNDDVLIELPAAYYYNKEVIHP